MKKNYLIAILALIVNFASAQIEQTTYRGAFDPNTPMWTDTWTSWDPQNEPYTDPAAANIVSVTTNITTNTTWTYGKTYKITGLIYVTNNATLTIQPGVIVKGVYTNTGTALIVTKGAKIDAVGTAARPIVFTSNKPAGQRAAGDWGGIILLGKAGFNLNGGINNIEGITASVNTQYGGGTSPLHDDNSGTLKYCRIEYPGFVFSPNNEINGLTLGSVGNGTTIDYVQVSYSGDDSFEWFGGSVNCKHLVAYKGLDDDFDTDNGYKGVVQFALGIRDPNIADNPTVSTSEGFESDNNADTVEAASGYDNTTAVFSNCTLIGPSKRQTTVASGFARALRLRRSTELQVYNSIFLDFKNNYAGLTDNQTIGKYYVNKLKIKGNIFAGFYGSDLTDYPNAINPKTLTGTSTTAGYTGGAIPSGTVFNLGTKMSGDGNIATASSDGILVSPYDTSDYTVYTNRDYRPGTGTTAASGATFSGLESYITTPVAGDVPTVTNRVYCKGDVARPLSATLTGTGASLKWYNAVVNTTTQVVSVGTLITTGAPTPVTTAAGVKYYYVSQVDSAGLNESAKVQITVTVNDIPTEVIGTITSNTESATTPGTYVTATTEVGVFVGTTTQLSYRIPAFVGTGLTYLWTVPSGVNIVSGQGTNILTVNYANVPAGAGTIGTINVQAVNSNSCKTAAKTLTITKALPTAPGSIALYNKNTGYATPTTAITNYGAYMGQTTNLTLTAATSATASSYKWELPAGVNLVIPSGTTPVTTTQNYTAEPFLSPATALPSAIATKYWTVTYNSYTFPVNGVDTNVVTSTAVQKIVGSERTYTFTITAGAIGTNAVGTLFTYNGDTYKLKTATTSTSTSVVCNASAVPQPAGNYPSAVTTTINGTLTRVSDNATTSFTKIVKAGYDATTTQAYTPYGTVVVSNNPSILVNFANVTNSATTKLYIGVKAVNSVGESTTSNTTNADVVANNALTTTSFNNIPGLYYNTYTETYVAPIATTLTNASSAFTLDTKYSTAYAAAQALLTPPVVIAKTNFPSTARLLTLTATVPVAPTTLVLTNPALSGTAATTAVTVVSKFIGTSTTFKLTAAVSALASSYSWELPTGVSRTDANGVSVEGLTSTDAFIYVNFANVASAINSLVFGVKAVNVVGSSTTVNVAPNADRTARLLTVTATVPAAPATLVLTNPALSGTAATTAITNGSIYIGTSKTLKLTAAVSALANTYTWELPTGVNRTDANGTSVEGLTSTDAFIYVNFANVAPAITSLVFGVKAVNGVGSSTTVNVAPNADRTAKLLTITASVPAAPATLTLTDGVTTTAVTVVSKFIGTNTPLKLTAAVSALANTYSWELPTGVNRTDAVGASVEGLTSTDPFIYVNFDNVSYSSPTTISLVFGVKAVNGVGSSSSVNVAPNADRTAKLLTVTAGLPAAVVTVSGLVSVCNRSEGYDYTITAPVGATKYTITAPVGSIVTSANGVPGVTNNILTTTDLTFNVVYSGTAAFPTTDKTLSIRSVNLFGSATTAKALALTKLPTCTARAEMTSPVMVSEVSIYPNPAKDNFNLELTSSVESEMSMTIYSLNGAIVKTKNVQLSEGNNVINEDISSLANGIYFVRFNNPTNNETIVRKLIKI
jgi:hypothetical protein